MSGVLVILLRHLDQTSTAGCIVLSAYYVALVDIGWHTPRKTNIK